ncbi:glycyl-radical enzyme activating protein [Gottschalkiaceae bacterium SANA]|nr:glycyl-radical enzyme activating protein [Gottschalkiaceae bacterium SANA]
MHGLNINYKDDEMEKALIMNVQKFSLHDGGGIRTLIFLKGCALHCPWCANPESQNREIEVMRKPSLCIQCSAPSCKACTQAPEHCPTGAMCEIGEWMDVDQLVEIAKKDAIFYDATGGGVTFSGGEPMEWAAFLKESIPKLKEEGLHVAVETCGAGPLEAYQVLAQQVDLWLFDLKMADNELSKKILGASFDALFERMTVLKEAGARVIVRIPLIPKYTSTEKNLMTLAKRVQEAGIGEVHLLPFHQYGEGKYQALNRTYEFAGMAPMKDEEAEECAEYFRSRGIRVQIGG